MSLLSSIDDRVVEETSRADIGGAVLAVDIGNVYTRAVLLDLVDGMYRFVARGESPTTAAAPWNNIFEGVRRALSQIAAATGRTLLDDSDQLILPERDAFSGVNAFAATASAGTPVRAVLVGLMPEVSLSSGRRAAESTYLLLVDSFSLADKRTQEEQINAFLQARAELVLIVGGTDNGAVASMRKQIATIALACSLMEPEHRPVILFAGNKALQQEVHDVFDEIGVRLLMAENVRPSLEQERLDSAQVNLASLYHQQRSRSTRGFDEVGSWTSDGIYPTAHGFSRMIHTLGVFENQNVLGIDLGSSDTTIAAYLRGHHYLNVQDGLGMGHTATGVLSNIRVENLLRWLSFVPEHPDDIINYVWNKWVFPQTVPASHADLEIEYALAREIMRFATLSARGSWRDVRQRGPLPPFGTILLAGSTLTQAPGFGWTALIALDAFLPLGITRLLADPYGVAASLGAVASLNPRAVVQTLDTGAFIDVGTAICISGRARQGDIVVRGSLRPEGSDTAETFEVPFGSIVTVPLAYGLPAELSLHLQFVSVENPQRLNLRKLKVRGGELGLIIDARGRPWRFPRDPEQRGKLLLDWQRSMSQRVET